MPRHLPPLRSLRAFEAAGRHLSFVKAADELAVTPAAISQQIKNLEEWAGQPLFQREPSLSLAPTMAAAVSMLTDAFDRMEQACGRLKPSQRPNTLVVSTSPSFAARWLLSRLERFQTLHPKTDVRLVATTRLVDFATEDVDVAIRFGRGNYPGLFSERLTVEEVVPVAAPRLARNLVSPQDLLGVTLLRNDSLLWDPNFPDWNTWLKSAGLDPATATTRSYGDEASLVIEAALSGLGVALMWRTLIADELDQGRLCAVFPGTALINAFHFVCPHRTLDSPPIAAFRAWIKAEMENQGAPINA